MNKRSLLYMAEYTTGVGNMELKAHFTSEKEVTIDQLVDEANVIWKYARARKLQFNDTEGASRLISDVQRLHPQFCQSYPLVNRYICEMQEYNPKAFRLWLMKIKERPWKSEAEYLDAQADYVAVLFRIKHPRATKTQINNLRINIRTVLQEEHDKFKYYTNEFDKEVTAEDSILKHRNKAELCEFVKIAGEVGMSTAETVRVVYSLGGPVRVEQDIDNIANNMPHEPLVETSDALLADE